MNGDTTEEDRRQAEGDDDGDGDGDGDDDDQTAATRADLHVRT